ncbi:MlaC/ttg2D family ABC transporter substrate-binding protein [Hylemonella gracilis]|uniref:Toluene tolerance family protein n=1 Tax=Hylemonella gracilis ATCC 19624 TaxID=887062 RepID=F3KS65_9BURK|nr:toluene tolerance family protein [Hylemonella gracilis ATCC 19624]
MQGRFFHLISLPRCLAAGALVLTAWMQPALAQAEKPADDMVLTMSNDVLSTIQADPALMAGNMPRLIALVDTKIMPLVNFPRMTASAVGPGWRQATPEQRQRLQEEFKTLLVRTYAGALAQVQGMKVSAKPMRAPTDSKDVIVRTELRGPGAAEPVQLDYRLEPASGTAAGWRIYNVNVMGVWLVETYRSQFAQEVNARGIDGLIASLAERNKATAQAAAPKN